MSDMEISRRGLLRTYWSGIGNRNYQTSQTSPVSLSGIIGTGMDQQDRDADERVRQLCLKAVAATSDEELEAALIELRGAVRDSMSRARERLDNLAILESQLKPAA